MISGSGVGTGAPQQIWAIGTGTPVKPLLTASQVQITCASAFTVQIGPAGAAFSVPAASNFKMDKYNGFMDLSQIYVTVANGTAFAWIAA